MSNPIEQHQQKVAELCRSARARRLDLFGSALRGDFDSASSDVDFLVEFDPAPPAEYAKSYFALKEGLEALLKRRVDLVTINSLNNPFFRERIEAQRQTIYAR